MGKMCGGLGDSKVADDTIREVIAKIEEELKGQVSGKLGSTPSSLHPVSYKTQVVAGTNFFVKVYT